MASIRQKNMLFHVRLMRVAMDAMGMHFSRHVCCSAD
jgi:hypothetical protein